MMCVVQSKIYSSKHDSSSKARITSKRSNRSQPVSGTNINGVKWASFGQLNAQKARDGYGKCSWSDGTTYAGEWKDGNMHGNGVLHFSPADKWYSFIWHLEGWKVSRVDTFELFLCIESSVNACQLRQVQLLQVRYNVAVSVTLAFRC